MLRRPRQLDDHHRNPNNNDRDHLVGQLTTGDHDDDYDDDFGEYNEGDVDHQGLEMMMII